jgi:pyruvate dehydrogenase E2 component (dihydrolipoamide acetyltransferase)
MSTSVTMPALGESVTEGTVTRWLKQEGDQVAADEPLLEVSTDKVDTEIPSPAAGVLQRIVVGEDETVAVGAELAVIGGSGGSATGGQQSQQEAEQQPAQKEEPQQEQSQQASPFQQGPPPQQAEPEQQAPAPQVQQQQAPAPQVQQQQAPAPQVQQQQAPAPRHQPAAQQAEGEGEGSAYVTPLVRKLASEHGVDLSALKGTGVGGRIRKQDVLEAAAAAKQQQASAGAQPAGPPSADQGPAASPVSPLRGTTEKMSRLRKVIASRMVESLQVSAQLTTVVEVDLTRIARLRQRSKTAFEAREGVKLSFLPFLAKATIEALKAHPKLNASIDMDKGEITYYDAEHLGVAVDTERGLLVPVVRDAGDLNIAGLARKIADLAERTRTNKIAPDELGGGTFTVTNTGSRGALFDTPIINQPQVAILGTGAVVKRPVVVDDPDLGETIAVRSMCYLALSYDHRIVDGADAARFLGTVKQRLEEGAFEADLAL